jgi:hypothetical protein
MEISPSLLFKIEASRSHIVRRAKWSGISCAMVDMSEIGVTRGWGSATWSRSWPAAINRKFVNLRCRK